MGRGGASREDRRGGTKEKQRLILFSARCRTTQSGATANGPRHQCERVRSAAQTSRCASVARHPLPCHLECPIEWERPYPLFCYYLSVLSSLFHSLPFYISLSYTPFFSCYCSSFVYLTVKDIAAQEFVLRNYHRLYLHVLGILDILRPAVFEVPILPSRFPFLCHLLSPPLRFSPSHTLFLPEPRTTWNSDYLF